MPCPSLRPADEGQRSLFVGAAVDVDADGHRTVVGVRLAGSILVPLERPGAAFGLVLGILAHAVGTESVAPYGVAQRVYAQFFVLFGVITGSLWVAYGHAKAGGDVAWIRRTYSRMRRLQSITFLVVLGIIVVGIAVALAFRTRSQPDNRIRISGNIELTQVNIAFKISGKLMDESNTEVLTKLIEEFRRDAAYSPQAPTIKGENFTLDVKIQKRGPARVGRLFGPVMIASRIRSPSRSVSFGTNFSSARF